MRHGTTIKSACAVGESMKTLIVEDTFLNRMLLQEYLKGYGECHIAVNGKEAVEAVRTSLESGAPYDLICLDIMMPEMDGQQALKEIRALEESWKIIHSRNSVIIMTTAIKDLKNVTEAYNNFCDGYMVKPIRKEAFLQDLRNLKLIP
jgi:two-component system, chemotaxis family, chemotaxis protein CheY